MKQCMCTATIGAPGGFNRDNCPVHDKLGFYKPMKQKNIREGLEATRSNPRDILHMIFCNYKHGHRNAPEKCDQKENLDEAMRMIDSIINEVIGSPDDHFPKETHNNLIRANLIAEQRNKWKQMKGDR